MFSEDTRNKIIKDLEVFLLIGEESNTLVNYLTTCDINDINSVIFHLSKETNIEKISMNIETIFKVLYYLGSNILDDNGNINDVLNEFIGLDEKIKEILKQILSPESSFLKSIKITKEVDLIENISEIKSYNLLIDITESVYAHRICINIKKNNGTINKIELDINALKKFIELLNETEIEASNFIKRNKEKGIQIIEEL